MGIAQKLSQSALKSTTCRIFQLSELCQKLEYTGRNLFTKKNKDFVTTLVIVSFTVVLHLYFTNLNSFNDLFQDLCQFSE